MPWYDLGFHLHENLVHHQTFFDVILGIYDTSLNEPEYDQFDITKRDYNSTFFDAGTCFNPNCQKERSAFPSDDYQVQVACLYTSETARKINIAHALYMSLLQYTIKV